MQGGLAWLRESLSREVAQEAVFLCSCQNDDPLTSCVQRQTVFPCLSERQGWGWMWLPWFFKNHGFYHRPTLGTQGNLCLLNLLECSSSWYLIPYF